MNETHEADGPIRILVICAANRARSPIVEALLKRAIADAAPAADVIVESAGICAAELGRLGLQADPLSARVATERGLDLSGHEVRSLDLAWVRDSALTVVMEGWQAKLLVTALPDAAGKVRLLHQLAGDDRDAPDIARLPDEVVRDFTRQAEETIAKSLDGGLLASLLNVDAGRSA